MIIKQFFYVLTGHEFYNMRYLYGFLTTTKTVMYYKTLTNTARRINDISSSVRVTRITQILFNSELECEIEDYMAYVNLI